MRPNWQPAASPTREIPAPLRRVGAAIGDVLDPPDCPQIEPCDYCRLRRALRTLEIRRPH